MSCVVCDPSVCESTELKNRGHYTQGLSPRELFVLKKGERIGDVIEVYTPFPAPTSPSKALCFSGEMCSCGSGDLARYWDEDGPFTVSQERSGPSDPGLWPGNPIVIRPAR